MGRSHSPHDAITAKPARTVNAIDRRQEIGLSEWIGVAIALVSSCLGGTAAAITRYLIGNADPITLAILRWGIGFACLLPTALLLGVRWPQQRDWPAVALLGLCFFGLFFVLYNIAIGYTTAARASLALATLPLHTMVVGALLGIEPAEPLQAQAIARDPPAAPVAIGAEYRGERAGLAGHEAV